MTQIVKFETDLSGSVNDDVLYEAEFRSMDIVVARALTAGVARLDICLGDPGTAADWITVSMQPVDEIYAPSAAPAVANIASGGTAQAGLRCRATAIRFVQVGVVQANVKGFIASMPS